MKNQIVNCEIFHPAEGRPGRDGMCVCGEHVEDHYTAAYDVTLADNLTAIVRERGPVRVTTDGLTTDIAPLAPGGRFCQSPFALALEHMRLDPFHGDMGRSTLQDTAWHLATEVQS